MCSFATQTHQTLEVNPCRESALGAAKGLEILAWLEEVPGTWGPEICFGPGSPMSYSQFRPRPHNEA